MVLVLIVDGCGSKVISADIPPRVGVEEAKVTFRHRAGWPEQSALDICCAPEGDDEWVSCVQGDLSLLLDGNEEAIDNYFTNPHATLSEWDEVLERFDPTLRNYVQILVRVPSSNDSTSPSVVVASTASTRGLPPLRLDDSECLPLLAKQVVTRDASTELRAALKSVTAVRLGLCAFVLVAIAVFSSLKASILVAVAAASLLTVVGLYAWATCTTWQAIGKMSMLLMELAAIGRTANSWDGSTVSVSTICTTAYALTSAIYDAMDKILGPARMEDAAIPAALTKLKAQFKSVKSIVSFGFRIAAVAAIVLITIAFYGSWETCFGTSAVLVLAVAATVWSLTSWSDTMWRARVKLFKALFVIVGIAAYIIEWKWYDGESALLLAHTGKLPTAIYDVVDKLFEPLTLHGP